MNRNQILATVGIAAVTSLCTFAASKRFLYNDTPLPSASQKEAIAKNVSFTLDNNNNNNGNGGYVNLTYAAEKSVPAVVHIEVNTKARMVETSDPFGGGWWEQFFGPQRSYVPPRQGSGSGVIISKDGYIVTNNHVVENADNVSVTLSDKQVFQAKVIGKDPSTDLAVIKIEGNNLPTIAYGNSDQVRLGEWVLAVGYPLNLEATVTAGIISAKSRSIGINQRKSDIPIESFLQTDAAVNPGNSGGALVNSNGELIGINSAIASPTGSYAGYSYAIPINLAKKIVDDLIKHGTVQRAFLGITPVDADRAGSPEERSAFNLTKENGIYVQNVIPNSGAAEAGIKKGDFITKINGNQVNNYPMLTEQIGRYSPGDVVKVTLTRDKTEMTLNVKLKNKNNNTQIIKNEFASKLGAKLKTLNKEEAARMQVNGGVLVTDPGNGALIEQTRIRKGFVITQINDEDVKSIEQLNEAIDQSDGKIQLSGIYPGYQGVYFYNINLK